MIRLNIYNKTHFDALNSYELDEIQTRFTADIDYCINVRKDIENPLKTLVTIIYEKFPVGFFVLDKGEDKYKLTKNNSAILIRSFSINPNYQGKGIGTIAMTLVSKFIRENIIDINEIVLSVNFRNKAAYRAYIKSGFIDN